jgi:hypothetical protein
MTRLVASLLYKSSVGHVFMVHRGHNGRGVGIFALFVTTSRRFSVASFGLRSSNRHRRRLVSCLIFWLGRSCSGRKSCKRTRSPPIGSTTISCSAGSSCGRRWDDLSTWMRHATGTTEEKVGKDIISKSSVPTFFAESCLARMNGNAPRSNAQLGCHPFYSFVNLRCMEWYVEPPTGGAPDRVWIAMWREILLALHQRRAGAKCAKILVVALLRLLRFHSALARGG